MVTEALKYNNVESILEDGEEIDTFGPEFLEKLEDIKMPASKLEVLIKLLRTKITEYGRTNRIASQKYQEMLEETIRKYHERRKFLSEQEAGATQEETAEDIIRDATRQAYNIMNSLNADRESFHKLGLTFEEKAFYDILIHLRDKYNFVYGEDKQVDGIVVNDKCKSLARKVREIIETKSSFADWLNNQRVRDQLKQDIKICLVKNGYPPRYTPEVFREVMVQVENYKQNSPAEPSRSETTPKVKIVSMQYEQPEEVMDMAAESFETHKRDSIDQRIIDVFDDDATILVGCYKNKQHLEWIKEHGLYNIRLGDRPGSADADTDLFRRVRFLVLYNPSKLNDLAVYDITGGREMTGEEMAAMGYPTKKPEGKRYQTFTITPTERDVRLLANMKLIERLKENMKRDKNNPAFLVP
jgi:hypothetical protein